MSDEKEINTSQISLSIIVPSSNPKKACQILLRSKNNLYLQTF